MQTRFNSSQTSTTTTERSLYDCGGLSVDEVDCCSGNEDDLPPAIPQKTKRKPDRQPSPYDNVPDGNLGELSFHSFAISLQRRGQKQKRTLTDLSGCYVLCIC